MQINNNNNNNNVPLRTSRKRLICGASLFFLKFKFELISVTILDISSNVFPFV